MATFGLICEGPSDRVVLERLITGVAGNDASFRPIQPPSVVDDKSFGGWLNVFASIRRGDVSAALDLGSDYIVIQVDTDVCEEKGFDVSHKVDGRERTEEELVAAVRARLAHEIAATDPDADLGRVLFAICVDEIECWLLLLLAKPKTTGCFAAVNKHRKKANQKPLLKQSPFREYQDAAKDLRKAKVIASLRGKAHGLDAFLASLDAVVSLRADAEPKDGR